MVEIRRWINSNGQDNFYLIIINDNLKTFCITANCKRERKHIVGQSSHNNCSEQQQGDVGGVKLPRLPYTSYQFCELSS